MIRSCGYFRSRGGLKPLVAAWLTARLESGHPENLPKGRKRDKKNRAANSGSLFAFWLSLLVGGLIDARVRIERADQALAGRRGANCASKDDLFRRDFLAVEAFVGVVVRA